jgi:hypothetical protein
VILELLLLCVSLTFSLLSATHALPYSPFHTTLHHIIPHPLILSFSFRCFGVKGIDDVLITTDLQGEQSAVTMHVKQGQGMEVLSILRDMQAERNHMRMSVTGTAARRETTGGN